MLKKIIYLSTLVIIGCTNGGEKSTVSLDLSSQNRSKVGALSCGSTEGCENKFILNVTGPNMLPIYKKIRCAQSASSCLLEVEVPTGEGRLFQLLMLEDQADGSEKINYGDVQANIAGAQAEVNLSLNNVGNTASEYSWSGRYFRLDGSKPTGDVNIFFKPLGDRPGMLIEQTEMIDGFFKFFMIQTTDATFAGFRYVINGERLFPNLDTDANPGVKLTKLKQFVDENQTKAGMIKFNGSSLHKRTGISPNYVWEEITKSDKYNYIFGSFGPGAIDAVNVDIKNMPFPSANLSIPWLSKLADGSENNFSYGNDLTQPKDIHYFIDSTTASPTDSNGSIDFIYFGLSFEKFVGFDGAFSTTSGGGISCSANCHWNYAVGFDESVIASVEVFKIPEITDENSLRSGEDDFINCQDVKDGKYGIATIIRMDGTSKKQTASLSGVFTAENESIVVCLKNSDGKYFRSTTVWK